MAVVCGKRIDAQLSAWCAESKKNCRFPPAPSDPGVFRAYLLTLILTLQASS
jgi:hypothetical protein